METTTRGRRPASPFADVVPATAHALVFTLVAVAWPAAGSWLPGARWPAVLLLTLGVLTNVAITFTRHFGDTLTRSPVDGHPDWVQPTFVVAAVGARFGWIVRGRQCPAGPRGRQRDGMGRYHPGGDGRVLPSDHGPDPDPTRRRRARGPHGSAGCPRVSVVALLMLASGLGGGAGVALRVLAGLVFAVFALAVSRLGADVALAVHGARPGAAATLAGWVLVLGALVASLVGVLRLPLRTPTPARG